MKNGSAGYAAWWPPHEPSRPDSNRENINIIFAKEKYDDSYAAGMQITWAHHLLFPICEVTNKTNRNPSTLI